METILPIYVKALSNAEWFGAWAPVIVRQEWLRPDGRVGLFTLIEQGLDEDDEYEFYLPGSLVIGVWDGEGFKGVAGYDADTVGTRLSHPPIDDLG